MKYTWFMFLVLTVAGGLIAFMGDRLGRYMGKRRMTVFGLRPRHTALCFTVVAGMLIALTSLGVMSSISKDVRVALFAVDDLTRQRDDLTRQRNDLTRQNRSLSQESKRLRADYEESKRRVAAVSREEQQSRAKLASTLQRLARSEADAERKVAALRREADRRARLAAEKSRQIDELGRRLARVQNDLGSISGRLRAAQARYREAETRRQEAVASFADISNRYQAVQAREVQARDDLSKAQARLTDLQQQVKGWEQQAKDAEALVDDLQRAQADLVAQRQELVAAVEDLKKQQAELKDAVRLAREKEKDAQSWVALQRMGPLIYVRGQELAWEVIDGRESRARIRERLQAMVERARAAAVSQGAGTKEEAELALVPVRFTQSATQAALGMVVGPEAIDAATAEISRANTSVVVQLKAATNTVAGDQVYSEIQVWVNRLVFHEGEPVARKVLNPRQPVGQIVQELVALLHGEVRSTAVARGMIPRLSSEEGILPSVQVGEIPLSDVVRTAERVRKQRGSATVEVVAATDLWAADSMKVSFRVSPGAAEPGKRPSGGILTIR
ncbi:MAG: DUF3084 domain-containing protein [Armatimonadetes bacterium]|jgi:uncharacterized protein (DUF3084 family)|nr:DUF3084 domain-containing protein [Armatimonadota bacterium]